MEYVGKHNNVTKKSRQKKGLISLQVLTILLSYIGSMGARPFSSCGHCGKHWSFSATSVPSMHSTKSIGLLCKCFELSQ
ncbi:hypothetical protein HanIR_Chr07g0339351 [Helianthus annuus]|nr:hypothetical protein HanIR_Chr07g0339351 [Helianthus annuus]